jgi:hypothetical protein
MEGECETFKQPAINDPRKHEYCQSIMGWCRRSCKKLSMYKQYYWNCIKQCQANYDQYLKVKELAENAGTSFPCKEILPGLGFEANLKID